MALVESFGSLIDRIHDSGECSYLRTGGAPQGIKEKRGAEPLILIVPIDCQTSYADRRH